MRKAIPLILYFFLATSFCFAQSAVQYSPVDFIGYAPGAQQITIQPLWNYTSSGTTNIAHGGARSFSTGTIVKSNGIVIAGIPGTLIVSNVLWGAYKVDIFLQGNGNGNGNSLKPVATFTNLFTNNTPAYVNAKDYFGVSTNSVLEDGYAYTIRQVNNLIANLPPGSGSGNVIGAPSSTAGTFALFQKTDGKTITNRDATGTFGPSSFDAAGAAAPKANTNSPTIFTPLIIGGGSTNMTATNLYAELQTTSLVPMDTLVSVGAESVNGLGGDGLILGQNGIHHEWRQWLSADEESLIGNGYVTFGGGIVAADWSQSTNSSASSLDGGIANGNFSLARGFIIQASQGGMAGGNISSVSNVNVLEQNGSLAGLNALGATNISFTVNNGISQLDMGSKTNVKIGVDRSLIVGGPPSNYTNSWLYSVGVIDSTGGFTGISNLVYQGNGSGLTNLSPAVATNNATAANGNILSRTGNNVKWIAISGGGDLLAANNGSDFASISTTRINLGVAPTNNAFLFGTTTVMGNQTNQGTLSVTGNQTNFANLNVVGTVTATTGTFSTLTAATTWLTNVVVPTNAFAGTVVNFTNGFAVTNLGGALTFTDVIGVTAGAENSAIVRLFSGGADRVISFPTGWHTNYGFIGVVTNGWQMDLMFTVTAARTNVAQILYP